MIPARLDFPCRTNADYTEELAMTESGVAVDLTGYTLFMTVRLSLNSDSLFDLETVATDIEGLRLVDAVNGVIGLRIDWETLLAAYDAVVTNIDYGKTVNLLYDIKFINSGGDEEIWLAGIVIVEKGVTNG